MHFQEKSAAVSQLGGLDLQVGYPFGDSRFQEAFDEVKKLKANEDLKPHSPERQDLAAKLFAVLTSYLRGCCVGLARSFAKNKDGFRLWRALLAEFGPPSRQRV